MDTESRPSSGLTSLAARLFHTPSGIVGALSVSLPTCTLCGFTCLTISLCFLSSTSLERTLVPPRSHAQSLISWTEACLLPFITLLNLEQIFNNSSASNSIHQRAYNKFLFFSYLCLCRSLDFWVQSTTQYRHSPEGSRKYSKFLNFGYIVQLIMINTCTILTHETVTCFCCFMVFKDKQKKSKGNQ